MTMHFIVSVGTSIIKKVKGLSLRQAHNVSDDENIFPEPRKYCHNYSSSKRAIQKNKGAEEKTIEKVLELIAIPLSDCHFHWISTQTKECQFCAAYLGHDRFQAGKNYYYLPTYLGEATKTDFVEKGVPSLLSTLAEILDQIEPQDQVVIIPTGGYKALIPYLTIAGILYKYPIYYIYEKSEALLELPALSLSVDITEFRSALVILDNIVGTTEEDVATPYLDALEDRFKNLLFKDDNHVYQYTAFGKRMKKNVP